MGCHDFLCKPKYKEHELGMTEISEKKSSYESIYMDLYIGNRDSFKLRVTHLLK